MATEGSDDQPKPMPFRQAGRWLVQAVLIYFEIGIGVSIVAVVAEAVGPSLTARGYNVRTGGGFMLGVALGATVAVYPVIWLDRLRRWWMR